MSMAGMDTWRDTDSQDMHVHMLRGHFHSSSLFMPCVRIEARGREL